MRKIKSQILILTLLPALLFVSCFEDNDDSFPPFSELNINEFVYRGLNFWYLYKGDVPDLANDRFDSEADKIAFLEGFDSPEATFDALLAPQDRFSVIRSDYVAFEDALAGISLSTGMRFSLVRNPNNESEVFGVVRYVVNNSPAADAGVLRGMLFRSVDGIELTENSDFETLFGQPSFTIDLATYDGTDFTPTGESILLNQVELTVNPVHTTAIIETEGNTVGYLHYTGFTNEFDSDLNAVFAEFQTAGITDLVLDLRYNGGGSIETANDLSSMITGQFNGQVFITQEYNEDRAEEYNDERLFNNQIQGGGAINSLNLNRVFVLTTDRTASASELILSGLEPYIEVIQIGTATTGKFEGSFLLYDAPAPNFSRSQANPNHRYVMLPLVLRSVNSVGFTDYADGISPAANLTIAEDFANLGALGDTNEPFLALALEQITGMTKSQALKNTKVMQRLYEEEQNSPIYQRMIVNDPIR
ncbi:S41 family peptidase [Croceiramulus getboli]|nr:S41 family peptidase [Flavobacteriaceae bacterium YJPT1-3]